MEGREGARRNRGGMPGLEKADTLVNKHHCDVCHPRTGALIQTMVAAEKIQEKDVALVCNGVQNMKPQ
ncbi:MAG: hypothetical protein C9356_12150 [Oleiphilus sp.]|nr:MAG: hypothetical protein C9356_12150 [Oleiphilus sp.]